MEKFQLNSEQKECLAEQVEELAVAADDLKLEKGKEKQALRQLNLIKGNLELLRTEMEKYNLNLNLRRQLAKELGADFVGNFHNGLATVRIGEYNLNSFVNKSGGIHPDGFAEVNDFKDGLAIVANKELDGKLSYCFINQEMENAFAGLTFTDVHPFSEGFAAVKIGFVWHFMDRNGDFLPVECGSVDDFSEGVAKVKKDGKTFFINEKGENVFGDRVFNDAGSFSEGLAWVKENERYFYINKVGEDVFKNSKYLKGKKIESIRNFSEGLGRVGIEGKWYYIDKQGKIKFRKLKGFRMSSDFQEGLAFIVRPGNLIMGSASIINKKGKILYTFDGNPLISSPFKNGIAIIIDSGKDPFSTQLLGKTFRYFIDRHGNKLFDEEGFEESEQFHEGVAKVKKNGEEYYIDIHGERIFN